MSKLLVTFMIFSSVITLWVYDVESLLQDRANREMHYALENAVHDASLQVNEIEMVEDIKVQFDQVAGHDVFIDTLTKNIPFDKNLQPTNKTLFKSPLEIKAAVYLDDMTLDPITNATLEFPYIYNFVDSTKGIDYEQVIFGPSVVYVVETQIVGQDEPTQFIKVQEYKR